MNNICFNLYQEYKNQESKDIYSKSFDILGSGNTVTKIQDLGT